MNQAFLSEAFENPIRKGHPYFDEVRKVFNGAIDRTPSCIFIARSSADVSAAIRYAKSNALNVYVKSGGHSAFGQSVSDGCVLIDMRGLKEIKLSADGVQVEVGGGVLAGELDLALSKVGLAIPLGDCPDVGVSGLALGGGNGFLSRKYGLTCDQLVEIELVTSDEEVLTLNQKSHSELFWAMKGAGQNNFGIVTKLTFKLVTPPSRVSTINVHWELESAPAILREMETLLDRYGEDLSLFPRFNCEYDGTPGLRIYGIYLGDESSLKEIEKALCSQSPPRSAFFKQTSYYEAQQLNVSSIQTNLSFHWENAIIPFGLSTGFVQELMRCLHSCPNSLGRINLDPLGAKHPDQKHLEGSAFYHRQESYILSIIGISKGANVEKEIKGWAQACSKKLFKNQFPFKYQNYAGLNDPLECYFGPHVEHLQTLKKKYDLVGLFGGLLN